MSTSSVATFPMVRSTGFASADFTILSTVPDGNCLIHALFGGENSWGQIQCPEAALMRKHLCDMILDYDRSVRPGVEIVIRRGGSAHPQLRSFHGDNRVEAHPQNIVNLAISIGTPDQHLGLEHVDLIARLKGLNILVYNEQTRETVELFYKKDSTELDHIISYNGRDHWSQVVKVASGTVPTGANFHNQVARVASGAAPADANFRNQVLQDISKYEIFTKNLSDLSLYDKMYVWREQTVAAGEGLIHKNPLTNRIEIYKRLQGVCSQTPTPGDKLLLEYCQAYGTIVFGEQLRTDLDDAMTATIFHKIARGDFVLLLSDEAKRALFFDLLVSKIKRVYNIDAAQADYARAKGIFNTSVVPLASFAIPARIVVVLSTAYRTLGLDAPLSIVQGDIVAALKTEPTTATMIDELFRNVSQRAHSDVFVHLRNRSVIKTIHLAELTAERMLRTIREDKESLKEMLTMDQKAARIYELFHDAFEKALRLVHTDEEDQGAGQRDVSPAANTTRSVGQHTGRRERLEEDVGQPAKKQKAESKEE